MIRNQSGRPVPWWAPGLNILLALAAYGLVIWIGLEHGFQAGIVAAVAVSLRAQSVHAWARWVH